MTLEQYLSILIKQWRLIVMCCLLVGAGASIGSKLTTPLYQSSALVQVVVGIGSNLSQYNNLLASEQLIQTEAILATSDPVLREVASHYKGLTVGKLSQEVTSTPKLNTQLFEIDVLDLSPTRAAALANDVAQTLVKQQLEMTQQANLLVVQAAQPNPGPVQPNNRLNTIIGLVIGLLLGMLLAALLELLDKRVRAPEALTKLLNRPVLATIWQASSKKKDVFNPTERDSNFESYRILRTSIEFTTINKPLHTVMITSAMPQEGRSTIAANLAIFMAKVGKTTLLIDADLRHPTQHALFDLSPDNMGFSDAVLAFSSATVANKSAQQQPRALSPAVQQSGESTSADVSLESFVYAVDIPHLWVMPSGSLPPNPSELLDSKAAHRLFEALASCDFDIVVFDTPPLLGLSDARNLASRVDGALVVVDITRAKKVSLKQVKALLAPSGVYIPGCIVNRQRRNRHDSASFYYDGYYGADEYHVGSNHKTENEISPDETVKLPKLPKM